MLPGSPAVILVGYEMSHLGKRVVCSSQVGLAVSTLPPSSPQASTLVTTGDVWTGEGAAWGPDEDAGILGKRWPMSSEPDPAAGPTLAC